MQLKDCYTNIVGTVDGVLKDTTTRTNYGYNQHGSLLTKREITVTDDKMKIFNYNDRNQLIEYRDNFELVASYTYDAEGYRDSKTVGTETTKFYWDRGYISNESDGTNFTAKNVIGLGGIVARKNGSSTPLYLMKDVHGDTTSLVQNNAEIGTYDYDAYGNLMESTGTQDNPFRYCGEYFDEETGFIYLRNRYYDPSIQRFISEDPAQDGTNWYVYCRNNPIRYIDPTGYITQDEIDSYESGKMAPGAYTYLMLCTYYYYLQNDNAGRDYWSGKAKAFRESGYTDTGDWFYNWTIEQMPKRPNDYNGAIPLNVEEHYFRNNLNIEFTWEELFILQSRLPDKLKWVANVPADAHQNNKYNGIDNIKYVSACGHFEIIYNANLELQTINNNWEDMGTYNYYSPINDGARHAYYDVASYGIYGNVPNSMRR